MKLLHQKIYELVEIQGQTCREVVCFKRSVFSIIAVLLSFLKYRRSVLLPKIVVSAFAGLVLNLCHCFSCPMTGSRFWYFCNNSNVTFPLFVEQIGLYLGLPSKSTSYWFVLTF